jgi:hypothetical protein
MTRRYLESIGSSGTSSGSSGFRTRSHSSWRFYGTTSIHVSNKKRIVTEIFSATAFAKILSLHYLELWKKLRVLLASTCDICYDSLKLIITCHPYSKRKQKSKMWKNTISVANPDPWPFWPLNPEWVKKSRSGSGINIPDHISWSLEIIFWLKIIKFLDADPESFWPWIRDVKIRIRN